MRCWALPLIKQLLTGTVLQHSYHSELFWFNIDWNSLVNNSLLTELVQGNPESWGKPIAYNIATLTTELSLLGWESRPKMCLCILRLLNYPGTHAMDAKSPVLYMKVKLRCYQSRKIPKVFSVASCLLRFGSKDKNIVSDKWGPHTCSFSLRKSSSEFLKTLSFWFIFIFTSLCGNNLA